VTEAAAAKKSCLRRGCFGCLIGSGVLIGILIVIVLIGVLTTPEVVRESDSVTHGIPPNDWRAPEIGEQVALDADELGRVILDVSMASFRIIPEPAGTPIRLDARYDSGSYRLTETFEPQGELGWSYRLTFGSRAFRFVHIDKDNRLELHLPAGTPITIQGDLGFGDTRLDLGGLWIQHVDIDTRLGDHEIVFSEPLWSPMERLEVNGSIGELTLHDLGNASPAVARVTHRMGELYVDLGGAWRQDADVIVNSSIGGFRVGAPPIGVGFELSVPLVHQSETHAGLDRPAPPEGAPIVRLEVGRSLGGFRLVDGSD
jgi:hypothetical protein